MNDFDPYDDAALRAEARELVRRDATEHRTRILLNRRPPAFSDPGELHPDIQQWADRFLNGDAGSLILIGTVGTGKTWSLWKAAETLVRSGWAGRVEIAAAYEVKEATDRPIDHDQINAWANADLFALDDIGAQTINSWDTDALFTLIDRRWQYKRPTVIASNEPKLGDFLGERAASRLADGATIVRFSGEDRRRAR